MNSVGAFPPLDGPAHECLEALLAPAPTIARHKQRAELLDVDLLRYHLSFDFKASHESLDPAFIPLTFLPKSPGTLFDFDFRNASGEAIHLPPFRENTRWSARLLRELAFQILGPDAFQRRRLVITSYLQFVAYATHDAAEGAIRRYCLESVGSGRGSRIPLHKRTDRVTRGWRGVLLRDDRFWWLLTQCAASCVVVLRLDGVPASDTHQQILKLSYTAQLAGPPRSARWQRSVAIFRRLGFRSFRTTIVPPWTRAATYHLEFHMPVGLHIVASRLGLWQSSSARSRSKPVNARYEHLYFADTGRLEPMIADVWTRPRAASLGAPAICVAILATALIGIGFGLAEWMNDHGSGAIASGLLAVPGFVAAYFSRPTHPIVANLTTGARAALMVVALTTYLAALRAAFVAMPPSDEQVENLQMWFGVLAICAGAATAILLAIRVSALVSRMKTVKRTSVPADR